MGMAIIVSIVAQPEPLPSDSISQREVSRLLNDDTVEFIWRNGYGGLTFRYSAGSRYFTWVPNSYRAQLERAIMRAAWVSPYIRVPEFDSIRPGFGGWWTSSAALPGDSAVRDIGKSQPARTVAAIATGLRQLHDRAPAANCPFRWNYDVSAAAHKIATSNTWRDYPDAEYANLPVDVALDYLRNGNGLSHDLVVCHGDPCSPNTIIDNAGNFVGLVDLGDLGVADRWADLAIASWSLNWNYGPGWEDLFFQVYGIIPNPEKITYYRLLWACAE